MGFDMSGPFEWGCWAKIHVTHNAPLFPAEDFSVPRLEKYLICYLLVFRKEGPLMLACSNVHVSRESSIFGNAFNMPF